MSSLVSVDGAVLWQNPPELGHFGIKLRKQVHEQAVAAAIAGGSDPDIEMFGAYAQPIDWTDDWTYATAPRVPWPGDPSPGVYIVVAQCPERCHRLRHLIPSFDLLADPEAILRVVETDLRVRLARTSLGVAPWPCAHRAV